MAVWIHWHYQLRNPSATVDDGSCEYDFVFGCIDELACNYVDTADVDDGSCIYPASDFVDQMVTV